MRKRRPKMPLVKWTVELRNGTWAVIRSVRGQSGKIVAHGFTEKKLAEESMSALRRSYRG